MRGGIKKLSGMIEVFVILIGLMCTFLLKFIEFYI